MVKWFTIVGFFADYGGVLIEHVQAETSDEAIDILFRNKQEEDRRYGLEVVDVFEGKYDSALDQILKDKALLINNNDWKEYKQKKGSTT